MISRRELTLAGLALAAAGTAEALRPRRRLVLLKKGLTIEQLLPSAVGPWKAQASDGLVTPDLAGKLAKSLYREIVARIYSNEENGADIMLLAAYGDTQSDLLQLHRPETCYPAVGFSLRSSEPAQLAIAPGAELPCRRVVAFTPDRTENILYWTRVGEDLPQSLNAQRKVRFRNAMDGFVADGILMRCSLVGDTKASFDELDRFAPQLIRNIAPGGLAALIGSRLAAGVKV